MDDARNQARRWVRRKRIFLTAVAVYLALSVLWLVIDLLTGPDDLWFYWPMLGGGLIVALIGAVLFGTAGFLGPDWERRQVDKYLDRRTEPDGR